MQKHPTKHSCLGSLGFAFAVIVVVVLVSNAVGKKTAGSPSTTAVVHSRSVSHRTITHAEAQGIWLAKFRPLVEAHAPGESRQSLHSPGVEYSCDRNGVGYECVGVVPEESDPYWIPGHETNCDYVLMTINGRGHITGESAEPIAAYREAFHVNVECHL